MDFLVTMSGSQWFVNAAVLSGIITAAVAMWTAWNSGRLERMKREQLGRSLQAPPGAFIPSEASRVPRDSPVTMASPKHMGDSSLPKWVWGIGAMLLLAVVVLAAVFVSVRAVPPSRSISPVPTQQTPSVLPDSTHTAGSSTSASSAPATAAPASDEFRPFGVWMFYFTFMLFGMAGQYMWGLKDRSEFNVYEFLKPLWVSLIVFAPFWSSLAVQGINYAAVAAAYQNGFFWKIVLDQQKPKTP